LFIENTEIGIVSFNRNYEYKEINSRFCGMVGFDRYEILKKDFPEPFWPSPFYSKSMNDIDTFMQLGFLRLETFFQRKNNTFFPVQLNGSIIPSQKESSVEFIFLIEDISEKKKKEREFKLSQEMLLSLNNKLEKLVKKRTRQIQQVMNQKNEFINQLGHDLKNPLTPLMTMMPILHNEAPNDKTREIISRLDRNVQFMKNLIVSTVELAKLDSMDIPLSFESINLKREIDKILQSNFSLPNNKNIQIVNDVDENIILDADTIRLNELVNNLVSNSLKYGKKDGSVTITGKQLDNKTVQFQIKDDGIGMSPEQVADVFKEFFRVNQQNSIFKSSGLGMSICKKIVERHGGSIHCESEGLGKGTTFTCFLPKNHQIFEDDVVDVKAEQNTDVPSQNKRKLSV
jgi:PAS domain S-box-containing protein